VKPRLACTTLLFSTLGSHGFAAPTGLNTIPTTDLVQLSNWIFGVQNGNVSFTGTPFYRMPAWIGQSQYGVSSLVEAGVDYFQTPDTLHNVAVFNAKALLMAEDDTHPNIAAGVLNVAPGQAPSYYVTLSKTLNYDQQQEERFKAHHRRNRKLLGRRAHVGLMLDGKGILQPFTGTDLQISESLVFQADWINGSGNATTAGLSYVLPDQKTVLTPALLLSNDTHRLGFSLSLTRQFP